MFTLNTLYASVASLTSSGLHGTDTANFAGAVQAEIKKKFRKEASYWVSFLGYFDPKNVVDNCVPSWFSLSERQAIIKRIEKQIETWVG